MAKQRGIHQYEVLAICTLVAHLSTVEEHVGMLFEGLNETAHDASSWAGF
ncbi:hypothetical protein VISP3789_21858 [Vibrio splendidus ATCC 33789]|nr:hypothetical protein VISP3789_21858 [Vibrio splendidus ATCC 33789]